MFVPLSSTYQLYLCALRQLQEAMNGQKKNFTEVLYFEALVPGRCSLKEKVPTNRPVYLGGLLSVKFTRYVKIT